MTYTPVELRHVRVGRSLFGYNRATVEQLIEEVAQSFESTWRERGELSDKVESLDKQLTEMRGREHLLTQPLIAAEQAASDVRERARREAETIVSEAHNEARAVSRAAQAERERLLVESRRIEGMLRGALGMIEDETSATSPAPKPEVEPEPHVAVEPEPEPVAAPAIAAVAAVAAAPVPDPEAEPEPEAVAEVGSEPEYGWTREDTREFDPIAPVDSSDAEPEHLVENENAAAEPVLERIPGAGSRDFDWGE